MADVILPAIKRFTPKQFYLAGVRFPQDTGSSWPYLFVQGGWSNKNNIGIDFQVTGVRSGLISWVRFKFTPTSATNSSLQFRIRFSGSDMLILDEGYQGGSAMGVVQVTDFVKAAIDGNDGLFQIVIAPTNVLTAGFIDRFNTEDFLIEVQEQSVPVVPTPVLLVPRFTPEILGEQTFRFTNQSTGHSSQNWDFGDGQVSTESSPTHIYAQAGTYKVVLTIRKNSTTAKAETNLQVVPRGDSTVKAGFTALVAGLEVTFTNSSTGRYDALQWNFGDGNTSTVQSPKHKYSTGGIYTVTLQVTSGPYGSTATKTVTVIAPAVPVPVPAVSGFNWAWIAVPAGALLLLAGKRRKGK